MAGQLAAYLTTGARLGEVVVAATGGSWLLDRSANAIAVDVPGGVRCFPMSKVAERLTEGVDGDLRAFYD